MIGLNSAWYPSVFSDLDVSVGPGKFILGSNIVVTPETILFVQPNATTYVYLSFAGGTIGVSEVGFPPGELPIAVITSDQNKILTLLDLRPDFSNMTSGSSAPHFSDAEIPSGAINGVNVEFELINSPTPATSLILTLNGLVLNEGIDYELVSQTITLTDPPQTADQLVAWYRY